MLPMTPIAIVGYVGAGLVVIAWLVVSFTAPSPKRAVVEWLGACGLYLALVALFTNLSLRAQESGGATRHWWRSDSCSRCSAADFVVSLVQTLLAFRGPSARASADATN